MVYTGKHKGVCPVFKSNWPEQFDEREPASSPLAGVFDFSFFLKSAQKLQSTVVVVQRQLLVLLKMKNCCLTPEVTALVPMNVKAALAPEVLTTLVATAVHWLNGVATFVLVSR